MPVSGYKQGRSKAALLEGIRRGWTRREMLAHYKWMTNGSLSSVCCRNKLYLRPEIIRKPRGSIKDAVIKAHEEGIRLIDAARRQGLSYYSCSSAARYLGLKFGRRPSIKGVGQAHRA